MPKINITEVDNTNPGSRAYSNFSVVVPGFHAPYLTTEQISKSSFSGANGIVLEKAIEEGGSTIYEALTDADVFGKSGIREFSSVSDFETYVGYVRPDSIQTAEYDPTMTAVVRVITKIEGEAPNAQEVDVNVISFYTVLGDFVEEYPLSELQTTMKAGELESFIYDGKTYKCTKIIDDENVEAAVAGTYNTKLSAPVTVKIPAHYGNQIAYELLNMGYTVLYVNMGEYFPNKPLEFNNEGTINETVKTYGDSTEIFNAIKALGTDDFWAELRDKTTYDFRFVLHGLIEGGDASTYEVIRYINEANRAIATLADYENSSSTDVFTHTKKRGDCLALIDLDEANIERTATEGLRPGAAVSTKKLVNAIKSEIRTLPAAVNKYSAIFCSSVTYTNNSNAGLEGTKPGTIGYNNSRFPASFHYLACFDNMLSNNFYEWFAVAGFNRGVATYTIDSTHFDLGDLAVQALEPRFLDDTDEFAIDKACNVIVRNRNNYYLWGNRTAYKLGSELVASHFLNIRQLCISIKKFVYTLCRNFTFDPNSDTLWRNFQNRLKPLLNTMKAGQGIRDYSIDKVATSLKGTLAARIRIIPIEAVEDFDIELALEDSLNGTVATVTD